MKFKKLYNLICESEDQEVVLIYPGRFQPPCLNHVNTLYAAITDLLKYINNKELDHLNVIISTSDKTEDYKSPFNFDEKKEIWLKHLENNKYTFKKEVKTKLVFNIIKNPKPYDVNNLIEHGPNSKNYKNLNTNAIVILGDTDKNRFNENKYFKSFKHNVKNLESYKDNAYLWIIDDVTKIDIDDSEVILRGHVGRKLLSDSIKESDKAYKDMFKKVFGWFDDDIAKLVEGKLK